MKNDNDNKEQQALLSELARYRAAAEQHEAEMQALISEQDDSRRALMHMLRDVEAEKHKVERLRREWVDAFDAVQEPIFIHDADFRILRANRAYAELAEQPLKKLIGQLYWEVFPQMQGPLPACNQALTKALSCKGGETETEEVFNQPDGRIYQSRSYTRCNNQGGYVYSIHLLEDITEKRKFETERRILSEALRQSTSGIVILDPELGVQYVNPALGALLGREPASFTNRPLMEIISPHRRDRISQIRQSIDETGVWHGEVSLLAGDGSEVPLYLSAAAINDASGKLIDYVGSYTDLRPLQVEQHRTETLLGIIEDLSVQVDLDVLCEKAVAAALQITVGEFAGIALQEGDAGLLRYRWYSGPAIDESTLNTLKQPFASTEGLTGEVLRSGEVQVVEDYQSYPQALPGFAALGLKCAAAVPIRVSGAVAGVLAVGGCEAWDPDIREACLPLLEAVARQLGIALQREQLQADLKHNAASMQTLLSATPIGIGNVIDRVIQSVNQGLCSMLGYTQEEMLGRDTRFLYDSEEEYQRVGEVKYAQIHKIGHGEVETQLARKDGQLLDVILSSTAIEADDLSRGVIFTVQDITDRKRAERAVKLERDRLNNYLDVVRVMFVVLDADGRVTLINRYATKLLGYAEADILGKIWIDHFIPPAEQDAVRAIFSNGITGEAEKFTYYENNVQCRNGQRQIAWSNAWLKDADGSVTGSISSGTDITEQRRSDALFRAITEQAGEGLSLADTSGRYLLVNPAFCRITGYSEQELLKMNVRELLPENIELQVFSAAVEGKSSSREVTLRRKDGSIFPAEVQGYPVNMGEDRFILGFVRDITVRQKHEQKQLVLTRTLRTLTACNSVLVHADSEQSLLDEICQTIVGTGGYRMAWVGFLEAGSGLVRCVAAAGEGQACIDNLALAPDAPLSKDCPTATTLRSGEPAIEQDVAAGPVSEQPWRQAALDHGFNAIAVLPLITGEQVTGALTLCSDHTDAFPVDEIRLLLELTEDLSYGIAARREQARREQAEHEVEESEARHRKIIQTIGDGLLLLDNRGHILFANYAAGQMLNRPPDDMVGTDFGYPVLSDTNTELELIDRNGATINVEVQQHATEWQGHNASVITLRDISARYQLERQQLEHMAVLERTLLQTVQSLATAVEKRDPYTAGHQRRVAELAVAIAVEMGLDSQRIMGIRLGGTIHDIGKIYIPADILNRPGKLSDIEFGLIREHPGVGYDIIKGVEFPWPVADMVYQHHERLDGSGYPQGLKGEEITLEARILSVADVMEAITAHRPYRAALGIEAGLEEIRKNRGSLYEPDAVDACVRLFEEKRFEWETE